MKIFLIRRRWLAAIPVALVLVIALNLVTNSTTIPTAATTKQLPIYSVERDQKMISISFDAAWGNEDTQQLIDILAKYNVKATFFVVGEWVEKYPESVLALYEAGHEIMNHSDDHAHMTELTTDEIVANLTACNEKIAAITGETPSLVRLPYGEYDDHVIEAVRSMGMEPIQWDVDSWDWMEISASEIVERVTGQVTQGSIVLFHNAALNTPEALPTIIENLLQNGFVFVPISEILIQGNYTIDYAGRQISE